MSDNQESILNSNDFFMTSKNSFLEPILTQLCLLNMKMKLFILIFKRL